MPSLCCVFAVRAQPVRFPVLQQQHYRGRGGVVCAPLDRQRPGSGAAAAATATAASSAMHCQCAGAGLSVQASLIRYLRGRASVSAVPLVILSTPAAHVCTVLHSWQRGEVTASSAERRRLHSAVSQTLWAAHTACLLWWCLNRSLRKSFRVRQLAARYNSEPGLQERVDMYTLVCMAHSVDSFCRHHRGSSSQVTCLGRSCFIWSVQRPHRH